MADKAKAKRERNNAIGCGVVVLAALGLVAWGGGHSGGEAQAVAKLPPSAVTQCRDLLAIAEKAGLIRDRPKPTRIDVEDALWAQLPAKTKDQTLQALACDVWQTAMPQGGDYVVAYGYRSGKRLEMLTSTGADRAF